MWPALTSGGKQAFVSKVLSTYRNAHGDGGASSASTSSSDGSGLQAALLTVLGVKQTKELVHVDMSAKLGEKGLLQHFPAEVWPQPHAVRELATKIKARERLGEAKPFIFAELRKCVLPYRFNRWSIVSVCCPRFVPSFCPEFIAVSLDVDANEKKVYGKRLEPTVWLLAWDAYALAAVATGQVGTALSRFMFALLHA
jgi:hypothetical protein